MKEPSAVAGREIFAECDCNLPERLDGIQSANANERGFLEIEVIHFPEYRSIIYQCVRCGRQFEGWYEWGLYNFEPLLDAPHDRHARP